VEDKRSVQDAAERKWAEEDLPEVVERFRSTFYDAPIGMAVVSLDGRYLRVNRSLCEILGYSEGHLLNTTYGAITYPEDFDASMEYVRRVLEGETQKYQLEKRYVHADGHPVWVLLSVSLIRDTEGRPLCFIAHVQDISERKRVEEELRLDEERLRGLADAALEGLVISDGGMILEANQALLDIFGYTLSEMVGRSVLEFVVPNDRDQVRQNILSGFEEPYEIVGLRKDGTRLELEVRGKAFSYRGRVVRVTAVRDITKRKALERRLRQQALYDLLTGLPNRALFMDRLSGALARGRRRRRRVAVMFVDLDNFKFVNDSLGHHAGDELLVTLSKGLRACLRLEDTLARLGGDEFAVLLEDVADEGEATRLAERIVEELRVPFTLDNKEVFITPSIGIALNDSSQDSPDGLLRKADIAMYWSKKEGKARYQLFEPSIEAQSTERTRLEHDLRRALEHDEFGLCYQPVVGVDSGRIMGVEALVRWKHPERGLVLPEEFVPLAEETGLIVPIGKRVLREACRQAREWQERYSSDRPFVVGVNLSARQLEHPGLADEVEEALRDSGLDPRALTLEITEGAVVKDEERNIDAMRRLGALGIRFALDDFGTGYSALAYLRRLPVGLLKLDRSFMEKLGEDGEAEVLLSGVISITSGLGLYVLAEGVETPEQLALVKSLGCDLAQGNYFSEPLQSEAVTELLETYSPGSSAGPR